MGDEEPFQCSDDWPRNEEGDGETEACKSDDVGTKWAPVPLGEECEDTLSADSEARKGLEKGVPKDEAVLGGGLESTAFVRLVDEGSSALNGFGDALWMLYGGVGPVMGEPKGVRPSGPKPKGKSEVANNTQASLEDSTVDAVVKDRIIEDGLVEGGFEDADSDVSDCDGSGCEGSGSLESGLVESGSLGSGLFESCSGLLGSDSCSPSVTGDLERPCGQMMHGKWNFGSLGNPGNWKETLGSLGKFQRTTPPPVTPQNLHPTITGRIVVLLVPGSVVVMKVLAVHSVFVVAWVEKFGGGIFIVDASTRTLGDDVGVTVGIGRTIPEDDVAFDAELGTAR